MIGPGKYDGLCTKARTDAEAGATLLIIIDGKQGSGFSVQCTPQYIFNLPALLRTIADNIEQSSAKV